MSSAFTPEQAERFDSEMALLLARYPSDRKQAAMLPALRLVQDMVGHLPPEALERVAARLGVPPTAVAEVATFYSMLRLEPAGSYVIDVCTNVSCSLCGAEQIVAFLEKKLGLSLGESSADGRFTLREVECLASCGTAPVLQINEDFHERLTPGKLEALLGTLK
ncbi:MAG: NADH-quinone oxidoreductase subunit NuoE family protein [Myxococcales bacterium]